MSHCLLILKTKRRNESCADGEGVVGKGKKEKERRWKERGENKERIGVSEIRVSVSRKRKKRKERQSTYKNRYSTHLLALKGFCLLELSINKKVSFLYLLTKSFSIDGWIPLEIQEVGIRMYSKVRKTVSGIQDLREIYGNVSNNIMMVNLSRQSIEVRLHWYIMKCVEMRKMHGRERYI